MQVPNSLPLVSGSPRRSPTAEGVLLLGALLWPRLSQTSHATFEAAGRGMYRSASCGFATINGCAGGDSGGFWLRLGLPFPCDFCYDSLSLVRRAADRTTSSCHVAALSAVDFASPFPVSEQEGTTQVRMMSCMQ